MFRILTGSGYLAAPSYAWTAMAATNRAASPSPMSAVDSYSGRDADEELARYRDIAEEKGCPSMASLYAPAHLGNDDGGKISPAIVEDASDRLVSIRREFSEGRYFGAEAAIEGVMSDLKAELAGGVRLTDRLLSCYYAAKVMLKVARYHEHMFRDGAGKRSVQILLMDSRGDRILLQRRGPFKRLFAGAYTVSANAKPKEGEGIDLSVAAAIKEEVGIDIDRSRILRVGELWENRSYLAGVDFYAFSREEEEALLSVARELNPPKGVVARYDSLKRSLALFTVDPSVSPESLRRVADGVEARSKIEGVYPVHDDDRNSLVAYRLTVREELAVRAIMAERGRRRVRALERMGGGADGETLGEIDSDEMLFVHWLEVRRAFRVDPTLFALDLTAPYFGRDRVWDALGMRSPGVISVDDPAAALPAISGGKGANTHFLRRLATGNPKLRVPETAVVSAHLFERVVLGVPGIFEDVRSLDRAESKEMRARIAGRIRRRIAEIELPEDAVGEIGEAFGRLGGDVAVRSSANSEDMGEYMAAGQADSFMHQITIEGVIESVIGVWQSLYSDGFVEYREAIGFPHAEARMAVLLQQFINAQAAGVVITFDQSTGRPIYRVTAQPGLGEGVVEGQGAVDKWLVGLTGGEILEREIADKGARFVADVGGGIRREAISIDEPSLDDEDVLDIANIAKAVHRAYRDVGMAEHIDLEYVLDREGEMVVVQARPKGTGLETDEDGNRVLRYTTIDLERLPPDSVAVHFYDRAQVAYPGVAVGRLQVLDGTARDVRPGVILVAHHTNNEFNGVFASLLGVITTDGDPTSHAGQHAFEKRIPCIVGAKCAFNMLEKYDGALVTFDASAKMFVLGSCPLKEAEILLSIWHADEEGVGAAGAGKDRHEIFRPWTESKKKRSRVFVEDYEGRWRRRSNAYGNFQLDYYYRAWDRLTEMLNSMFAGRRPWKLEAQGREIKVDEEGKFLWHAVAEDDPKSIYYYLMGVDGFGIADCERLFDARWEGFRNFAAFMGGVDSIDRGNVSEVVDNIIEIFVWMHMGFWIDSVVEGYASKHLQYVNDEGSFHNVLRSEAVSDLRPATSIDPLREDVPPGKILHLSRNKDKEIYAALEAIRGDPAAVRAFGFWDAASIRAKLMASSPEIYDKIEGWSMRYKNEKEHLDHASDTDEYLSDLKRRLENASVPSAGILANFYRTYLKESGGEGLDVESIETTDSEFYLMLMGRARLMAARESHGGWEDMSPDEQGGSLIAIGASGIDRFMGAALDDVRRAYAQEEELRQSARRVIDTYPELARTMALYEMQLALREDGHHLIVPHQRRLAQMLLEAARPFVPTVLSRPEDVFDIATEELVALLRETDPSYVKATFRRNRLLDAAELEMVRQWSVREEHLASVTDRPAPLMKELVARGYVNHYGAIQERVFDMDDPRDLELSDGYAGLAGAIFDLLKGRLADVTKRVREYAAAVDTALGILKRQEAAATIERVKDHYRGEAVRLKARAAGLLSRL